MTNPPFARCGHRPGDHGLGLLRLHASRRDGAMVVRADRPWRWPARRAARAHRVPASSHDRPRTPPKPARRHPAPSFRPPERGPQTQPRRPVVREAVAVGSEGGRDRRRCTSPAAGCPGAGSNEVLAGCQTTARDRLAVAGHDFTVVGVLRRDVALLVDCYLAPPHDSLAAVFDPHDTATHPALLLELTAAEMRDHEVREKLKALFPPDQFAMVASRGPRRTRTLLPVSGRRGSCSSAAP